MRCQLRQGFSYPPPTGIAGPPVPDLANRRWEAVSIGGKFLCSDDVLLLPKVAQLKVEALRRGHEGNEFPNLNTQRQKARGASVDQRCQDAARRWTFRRLATSHPFHQRCYASLPASRRRSSLCLF